MIETLLCEREPYHQALRALRRAAGLSQLELAESAGLCPNTIGNLERGNVVRPWNSTHERVVAGLRTCGVADPDLLRLEQAYRAARRDAL